MTYFVKQLKADTLHLDHILFYFNSILLVYRGKMIEIVALSKYFWTFRTVYCENISTYISEWGQRFVSAISLFREIYNYETKWEQPKGALEKEI